MNWLKRAANKKTYVSVELTQDGLVVAAAKPNDQTPKCLQLLALNVIGKEAQRLQIHQLQNWVKQHQLEKSLCHITISPDFYQLLLVDTPPVPEKEVAQAVRWKVKDLLQNPIDSIVMDTFTLPSDGTKSGKSMTFVVAAEKDKVLAVIKGVEIAGLKLQRIEIEEMALRNLALLAMDGEQSRGEVFVRLREGAGSIHMFKEGNLYLSRQFKLPYKAGLFDELPIDNLALEIQRSLDYCERHMGLAPPVNVWLCGENVTSDKVSETLKRSTTVPISFLDLGKIGETVGWGINIDANEFDEPVMQMGAGAIGCLLGCQPQWPTQVASGQDV